MLKQWTEVVGRLQTNCYIVTDGKTGKCAVIDPGAESQRILDRLNGESLKASHIFLTHGHFDHITAVETVREATGALVVTHSADARMLKTPPDITVHGGEYLAVGELDFFWMHTPGHTPGSCCIICEDNIYSGDTLFEDDCGRTDLPGGNAGQMAQSLRRLAELEGDYKVFPGHDVATTLERERECNADMRRAMAL